MSAEEFVVQSVNPWRTRLGIAALLALLVCAALVGAWLRGAPSQEMRREIVALQNLVHDQRQQLEMLRRELAEDRVGVAASLHRDSAIAVQFSQLEAEIESQSEELHFYRELFDSNARAGEALKLVRFAAAPTAGADSRYEVDLVLAQRWRPRQDISGAVELVWVDQSSGQEKRMAMPELIAAGSVPDTYPVPFRFRYFQALPITVTMPDDFAPSHVEIRAKAAVGSGKRRKELIWERQWPNGSPIQSLQES